MRRGGILRLPQSVASVIRTHTHIYMQLTHNCSFAKFFVISSRNKSSLSLIDAKGAKSVFVCDFSIFTAKCVEIAIFMAFIFSQEI